MWGENPGKAQLQILAARINSDGLVEQDLELIIRGYVALRGTEPNGDFDPLKYLVPKTLYAASKWPDYLAAGRNPPAKRTAAAQGSAAQQTAERTKANVRKVFEDSERREGRDIGQS